MTTLTTETQIISESKSWLQKHERLILVTLGLLVIFFLGHKYLDGKIQTETAAVSSSAKILATQDATNKQLQQNYTDLQKQQAAVNAQIQAQNSQLASQAAEAYKAAATQATADQQMNNQQLASRLDTLTNQKGIQSSPEGVDLTHQQATTTTVELEQVPELQAVVASDNELISNDSKEIVQLTNLNDSANINIQGLNKQIADQTNSCKAEVKLLKTQSLKSKIKWALGGFITGFVTGVLHP